MEKIKAEMREEKAKTVKFLMKYSGVISLLERWYLSNSLEQVRDRPCVKS
jgi:hypothetical protein